jgi:hypothetical protein
MSYRMQVRWVAERAATLEPITSQQVAADVKKHTKKKAGAHQTRLGNVKLGANAYQVTPRLVTVSLKGHTSDLTNEEIALFWEGVLQALLASGYTLVGAALSDEYIFGGEAALADARQTQIVAVVKEKAKTESQLRANIAELRSLLTPS